MSPAQTSQRPLQIQPEEEGIMRSERILGRALSIEELNIVAGGGDGTGHAEDTIECTPAKDNEEEETNEEEMR